MQNTWLIVALGLVIGCGSSTSLSRSDGSAGGTTGGAGGQAGSGAGGGRGGIGGGPAGGGAGIGGGAGRPMDGGQDRLPQILDGAADHHVVSDAKTCTGTFTCVLCSTDDVSTPGVCSDGGWTCPGGYAPFGQCPPCSGLPPPSGCSCNHSNGVITCPKDGGTDK